MSSPRRAANGAERARPAEAEAGSGAQEASSEPAAAVPSGEAEGQADSGESE